MVFPKNEPELWDFLRKRTEPFKYFFFFAKGESQILHKISEANQNMTDDNEILTEAEKMYDRLAQMLLFYHLWRHRFS